MASAVALVSDLIFASKIEATARLVGAEAAVYRTLAAFHGAAKTARLAMIDMNVDPSACLELIRTLKSEYTSVRIVAFLSHVQVELARQVEAAGADEVWAKSKFTDKLAELLRPFAVQMPGEQPPAR